jgi:hypothetical protein
MQKVMRETMLDGGCFGPFNRLFNAGDTQQLTFKDSDAGPFKLSLVEQQRRKPDAVGRNIHREKTKPEPRRIEQYQIIPTNQKLQKSTTCPDRS